MKINPDSGNISNVSQQKLTEEVKSKDESKFDLKLEGNSVTKEESLRSVDKLEEKIKKIISEDLKVSHGEKIDYEKVTRKILSEVILDIFPSISNSNGLKEKMLKDIFQVVNEDPTLRDYFKKFIERINIK